MNLLSFVSAVTTPNDLWARFINWIGGSVANWGWTIILVTAIVKLVTAPLDFFVKLNTKKQTLVQQKCAPEIAKLQKKFGADQNSFRIQAQSVYKRNGLDQRSGCAIMLINTILSCTIFLTFYNSLRKVSAYEAINQYEQIETTYKNEYYSQVANFGLPDLETPEQVESWLNAYKTNGALVENGEAEEGSEAYIDYQNKKAFREANEEVFTTAATAASNEAIECWKSNKNKSSWLWIQNIWVADSNTKLFPTYSALKSNARNTGYGGYVLENINESDYNQISNLICEEAPRQNNGYFILAILAGLITFASQYIAELHTKLKNKKANKVAKAAGNSSTSTMKTMKIVMPLVMVIFVLTASASFGLYILASNFTTIATGEITTIIIDALTKKKRLEVEEALEKEANKLIKKGQI